MMCARVTRASCVLQLALLLVCTLASGVRIGVQTLVVVGDDAIAAQTSAFVSTLSALGLDVRVQVDTAASNLAAIDHVVVFAATAAATTVQSAQLVDFVEAGGNVMLLGGATDAAREFARRCGAPFLADHTERVQARVALNDTDAYVGCAHSAAHLPCTPTASIAYDGQTLVRRMH